MSFPLLSFRRSASLAVALLPPMPWLFRPMLLSTPLSLSLPPPPLLSPRHLSPWTRLLRGLFRRPHGSLGARAGSCHLLPPEL